MASKQHRETIDIPAGRGTIFDRTGAPLAIGEQATTVYADPRNVVDPKRAAIEAGRTFGLDPNELYGELRDRSTRLPLHQAQGRPGAGGRARAARASPASASTARSGACTRSEPSPRTCSGSRAPTTTAWKGSSGRWTASWPAAPAPRRSSATPSVGRSTSSRHGPERPGSNVRLTIDHEIQASGRGDPRQDGAHLGREGGDGDRDGHAHRRGAGDGERPDLRREPVRLGACRGAAQPRGHGHVRAGVDIQDRDDRRGARGRCRDPTHVVRAAADDQGRRPSHPRVALAADGADDRAPDPRRVVEHRHRHGRRAVSARASSRRGSSGSASAAGPASTIRARARAWSCRSTSGRDRRSAPCRSGRASP